MPNLFDDFSPPSPTGPIKDLTVQLLREEAQIFSKTESTYPEPTLFGVSDGKTIGTYLEHKFTTYLINKNYSYQVGNSAKGLDLPGLEVDIKVTSMKQPQSSSPFRSIRQKVYGLGYSLLIFVYDKTDDPTTKTAILKMVNTIFVEKNRTADFQMTSGIRQIIQDSLRDKCSPTVTKQELIAYMESRTLTSDEFDLDALAEAVMTNIPEQGYLTISPAMQWRLQYQRVVEKSGTVEGIFSVYKTNSLTNFK